MTQSVELRIATNDDIDACIAEAIQHFFSGSEEEARDNLGPFDANDTSFIIAYEGDEPVATVTVRWKPNYPPFKNAGIPFIQNIEVKWELRGKGYGSRVMEAVEQHIATRADKAGICVALFDDYGPAQRLYAKRGYIPDGRGACHRFTPLQRGQTITLDDDHLLWLVKDLSHLHHKAG
jgi:GNAT superfamily N-acetyltransferase